jgi:hypothetical protein
MEAWEITAFILKSRWRMARENSITVVHELSEFNKAVLSYIQGSHTKLAEYLYTRQLSRGEQAELARALVHRAAPIKRGRPKSLEQLNKAEWAKFALFFYQAWRDLNEENGVDDWGHRDEMKQQACQFVVEIEGLGEDSVEDIRQLVDRPISRRKSE